MLPLEKAKDALAKLFRERPVADLKTLCRVLRTDSRMSVFRRLSEVGYVTSYSHTGRYYTLAEEPDYDEDGIWICHGVGFSQHGSLKATVEHLVGTAEAGHTHRELQVRLLVRVHNVLLELVRLHRIGRETVGSLYLYVSPDVETAREQVARRLEPGQLSPSRAQGRDLEPSVLIEVLLEIIHASQRVPSPRLVERRLAARSIAVTLEQVEDIFLTYGLKKTLVSRSRHLRP